MMLERLGHFANARHNKSGKPMSMLQKLILFMGSNRRSLRGARSLIEVVMRANPNVKLQCHDALRAIGSIEDALSTEYELDRQALLKQKEAQDAVKVITH